VLDRHGALLYESRSATGTRGTRIAPSDIPAVVAAARTLERLAQTGDLTAAAEAERRLQRELTRLVSYLESL